MEPYLITTLSNPQTLTCSERACTWLARFCMSGFFGAATARPRSHSSLTNGPAWLDDDAPLSRFATSCISRTALLVSSSGATVDSMSCRGCGTKSSRGQVISTTDGNNVTKHMESSELD